MKFQSDNEVIVWKINCKSTPSKVFEYIATDECRNKFWAVTQSKNDIVTFAFANSYVWEGKILESNPPTQISFLYIDNSEESFELIDDGNNGTDLILRDKGVKPEFRTEVIAGWGSVLMTLKAAVDFNVDLRNHDPKKTWSEGFFNN